MPCNVQVNSCRFEKNGGHFTTEDAARAYYESTHSAADTVRSNKRTPTFAASATDRIRRFGSDLNEMRDMMETYLRYRRRGQNESEIIPFETGIREVDESLDTDRLIQAWRSLDFNFLSQTYAEAMKRYYVNRVFRTIDIDYLPSDKMILAEIMPREQER